MYGFWTILHRCPEAIHFFGNCCIVVNRKLFILLTPNFGILLFIVRSFLYWSYFVIIKIKGLLSRLSRYEIRQLRKVNEIGFVFGFYPSITGWCNSCIQPLILNCFLKDTCSRLFSFQCQSPSQQITQVAQCDFNRIIEYQTNLDKIIKFPFQMN